MDLQKFHDKVSELNLDVKRIVVYKEGEIFARNINGEKQPYNCYSVSKNFTATAIGMLIDDGKLSLDDKIVDIFKNELPAKYDEKLNKVTVENLLMQRMGVGVGYLYESDRYTYGTDDWLTFVLSQPLDNEPNGKFEYSNSTFYLLSIIVEKISGEKTFDFLDKRLFKPLGFENYSWEDCPKGHTFGASSITITTDDMLKLGILYLNKGVYNGKRILSEEWVDKATHFKKGMEADHYCYSFWRWNDEWYSGNGSFNQQLYIVPGKNTVVAIHSHDPSFYNLFPIVEQTIL